MTPVINMIGIEKRYVLESGPIQVLKGINLRVEAGEMVAIMGPSGSGKSTLMNIIGCLDVPSAGTYQLDGLTIGSLSDRELARIRNRKIGFIFQGFNLLKRVPAVEQVELPLIYARESDRRKRALAALALVGLGNRTHHVPSQLSGGQQQRIAIARALVNQPAMILADEPTGNLDTRTSEEILDILQTLNAERGITVVMVTHELDVAHHMRRVVILRDGRIQSDEPVQNRLLAREILPTLPVQQP